MRHVVGILTMAVGVSMVLALVVGLNARQQPPREPPRVSREIHVAPPPPKPKDKPKPRPQRRPPKQVRRSLAPPPDLSSGISQLSLGGGPVAGTAMLGAGSLIGEGANARDLVMTEDAVDAAPRPTSRAAPVYPPRARANGVTGVVSLSLLIDTQGNVQRVKILESSPPGVFDDAAVDAVRRWRFDPASYRGQKVKVWARQNVRFSLQ